MLDFLKRKLPLSMVRWIGAYQDLRRARIEREHLEAFRAFYEGLEQKKDIFYLYFSAGLAHWVYKALRFVPRSVNAVVIGGSLSEEEEAWSAEHLGRPFHHIQLPVGDRPVLEFLFKTNRYNFGWLHVDCLVLNPAVFEEMTQIRDDVAVNCAWSHLSPEGNQVLNTYLLFFNQEAIRATAALGITPNCYCYRAGNYAYENHHRFSYCQVPTKKQLALLGKVLPKDAGGRPQTPPWAKGFPCAFFDTLLLFQFTARALGFRLHAIRDFHLGDRLFSDELIHMGNPLLRGDPRAHWERHMANYLILHELLADFPRWNAYLQYRDQARALMQGIDPDISLSQCRRGVFSFLAGQGLSEQALNTAFPRTNAPTPTHY